MKRLLTAGIFGTILGIVGTGTANASIVSSGFLDEKLTEYALSTSLDLKANQSDFTELNTQISESVDNLKSLWDADIGILAYGVDPNKFNNDIIGAFGLVEGFFLYSMESLTDGWTDKNDGTTYLGVKDLNTKIGTLPDGLTVANLYDGWTDSKGVIHRGLNDLSTIKNTIDLSVEGPIAALMGYENGYKTQIGVVHNTLFIPIPEIPNLYNLVWRILEGGAFPKFAQEMYGIPGYKGLVDLTKGVGDLPSGNFPTFPGHEFLFLVSNQPLTYPTSLAELITAIYGNSEIGASGLLAGIVAGFPFDFDGDDRPETHIGLYQNHVLAKKAYDIADANTTKIGTVPDGKNLAGMIGTLPAGYDSVGAALSAIKGIAEDAKAAALAAIPDPKQEGSSGKFVLTVDIVGDNATYHWEKIDREGETTTTTE